MKKLTVISLSLILVGILLLMFGCAKSEESKTKANDTGSIITESQHHQQAMLLFQPYLHSKVVML